MPPRRLRRRRNNLTGADIVAIILACGVSLVLCLIIVGTIVQILHNTPGAPEIQLSENATQIIISGMGGIIGVLGGYIGYRMHQNHSREKYMDEEQTLPATPPGQGAPPPGVAPPPLEPEGDPLENDDKTDVQPRPEPKEGEEGDPHGSPLDDPEDDRYVRRDPDEPAA
jgi:hypothetical protein